MFRKGDTIRISQPAPSPSSSSSSSHRPSLPFQPAADASSIAGGSSTQVETQSLLPAPAKGLVAAVVQHELIRPEWRAGVANLCKKYPEMEPAVIARELALWGGHAGKAAHALQQKQQA